MRSCLGAVLTGVLLFSFPAAAGTVVAVDGKITWQSTQCQAPALPPSLAPADSEAPADSLNKRIADYNQYAALVQTYMDCLNSESGTDAKQTSQTIISAAHDKIVETETQIDKIASLLKIK